MKRLYTASDVRRYARCPRQWWYEARSTELATLSSEEIERRRAVLRRRYGARAEELAAYQLLADLAIRHERLAHGRASHAAHAHRALRPRIGCMLPLLGLISLLFWICQHAITPMYSFLSERTNQEGLGKGCHG